MAAEVLRPTSVQLNGWTGDLSDVLPPIGSPNPSQYIESETFVQSTYDYRNQIVFGFDNPVTVTPDTLRVRTVVQRTGTTGDLTYQVRLKINYYPFGSNNPYPRVLTSTHTIGATDTGYHEVIDVFSVNTNDISGIDTLSVEYSLAPSGTNNSVTGVYDLQQMTADGGTLRLLSVAVEADQILSSSPTFSPPTMSYYMPWDLSPAYCLSSSQQREAITPQSFLSDTDGFTGHLQQLQDPLSTTDTATIGTSGVNAIYTTERPVLSMRFMAPQRSYDSAGFLNLRWKAHTLTGADVQVERYYFISAYYQDAVTGERVWLGTFKEHISAVRNISVLNPKPGWTATSIALPLPVDANISNIQVSIYVLEDVTQTYLSVTSIAYGLRGVRPISVFSPPGPPLPPTGLILSPPVPDYTLLELPGSPPVPGPPVPYIPTTGGGGTSCVSPPPPPLPPGSEVLRPNRDIQSLLVNPKPIWMQLNDPVYSPCDTFVAAPAEMDIYDETTGDYVQTYRAKFEVGFTQPQNDGPWQALQVRFVAARSRPPANEAFNRVSSSCPDVVTGTYPGAEVLTPNGSILGQTWSPGPAWWAVNEPIYQPDGCFVSEDLTEVSPLILSFSPPTTDMTLINGWSQFTATVRARIRALQYDTTQNQVSGISGNFLTFSGLVGYQIRFEPKNALSEVTAIAVSPTRIEGTAMIRANIDTWVEFQLVSPHHTIIPLLSVDGSTYQSRVRLRVQPLHQRLIYFSIDISQNGDTPVGQYSAGLICALDGDTYVTPDTLQTGAITFNVQNNVLQNAKPTSLARLKGTLLGETFLATTSERTSILKTDWTNYQLTWGGQIYPIHSLADMRLQLDTEVLYRGDETCVVDIDVVSLTVQPYIQGLTPEPTPPTSSCQLALIPVADLSIIGWSEPCSPKLRSVPASAERSVSTEVSTLISNNMLISMDFESNPDTSYADKTFSELIVQVAARVLTSYPSIDNQLTISTNMTGEQSIRLSSTWQVLEVVWVLDPPQGLSVFDNGKMRVQISGKSVGSATTGATIQIAAVRALIGCSAEPLQIPQTVYGLPLPPRTVNVSPSPVDGAALLGQCTISTIPSTLEVFSAGALKATTSRPAKQAFKFLVNNRTASTAVVKIDVVGAVEYWITPASLQNVLSGQAIEFFVYLAVGSSTNPYPDEVENGLVRVALTVPGFPDRVSVVRWVYNGTD